MGHFLLFNFILQSTICYLIMYSKNLELDYCKLQFLQLLSDYVFDLTGQHVAYNKKLQIIKG